MPHFRTFVTSLRRWRPLGTAFAVALLSCGREQAAPTNGPARFARALSFTPVFPRLSALVSGGSAGLVPFTRAHIVLRRAGGALALESDVAMPAGVDAITVALKLTLSVDAPESGESLQMNLDCINAAGETVFRGGPVTVLAFPDGSNRPAPAPVDIPLSYSGPGANARRVVISPRTLTVSEGGGFALAAVAQDASGAALPGTPIVWGSIDPLLATMTTPASGAAGAGIAGSTRGSARIVAELLTGLADTVTVRVLLRAASLAAQSGDAQSNVAGAALAQPIVARVIARDGVGVGGVPVSFAVATGGGSTGSATVVSDTAGFASTSWKLGTTAGSQSVTVSAAGLGGSPLTFTATAASVQPVRLVFSKGPAATNFAGTAIGPLTVTALDGQGAVATSFAGAVSIDLASTSTSAPLIGTLTTTAVAGVATFADLRFNIPNSGYVLAARASGLVGATSAAFAVVAGPAVRLEFGGYPAFSAAVGPLDAVSVVARDVAGNHSPSFAGAVTLALAQAPAGATLGGSTTATAISGMATFESLVLTRAGTYQLSAATVGMVPITGPPFVLGAAAPIAPAISPPVAVSAGGDHTCVVRANGTIWCWGANATGQLGDGTTTRRLVPTQVVSGVSFASVSAGGHTCALTAGGTAYCWGGNNVGQLGTGNFTASSTPVAVAGGLVFAKVIAGSGFSCGYTTAGVGYCWGAGGVQLGNGVNGTVNTPTAVAGGLTLIAMSLFADNHVCAVATGGTPYCWGYNADGAVGDNTTSSRPVPTLVAGGVTMSDVASAHYHSCGLTIAGAAYCWGDNNVLQLGWGTPGVDSRVPGPVVGGYVFSSLTSGHGTCGLLASGAAYCWGYNANGELGDGTNTWRAAPVPVTGGLLFSKLSSGNGYKCGITTGGALYCWGYNVDGELGDGTTTGRLVPVIIPLP